MLHYTIRMVSEALSHIRCYTILYPFILYASYPKPWAEAMSSTSGRSGQAGGADELQMAERVLSSYHGFL